MTDVHSPSLDSVEAGAPASVRKNGFGFPPTTGEAKLAAEFNISGDPIIYLNHKLIEIIRGDQTRADYLSPLKIDGLDHGGTGLASRRVP